MGCFPDHIVYWMVACVIAGDGSAPGTGTTPYAQDVDKLILLLVDPAVQSELKLTSAQKTAIQKQYEQVDRQIWVLRDWPAEKSADRIRPLIEPFNTHVRQLLKPGQETRLNEIILQYRGPDALLQPELAEALSLSSTQRKQIRAVLEDTQEKLHALGNLPTDEKADRKKYQEAHTLKSREQKLLLAILNDDQKQKWVAARGERFDLTQLQTSFVRAPELEDADSKGVWLNSDPLSLTGLRGQVVVVHFWTFGCSNCIHNYPHYKRWQEDFRGKDVTIIGIHTPETDGERSIEKLRAKVKENGLLFPILVDNRRQNWDAWGNNVWPSVYLVDRQGRVRYWWYGELKWAGRDGEKLMRARIEDLLAEDKAEAATKPAATPR